MKMQRMRKLWRAEEGSALVEGAIVTPVLFILVFGVLEFSFYFYQQHLVSTGVRDAARYVAHANDPTAGATQTVAQNLAATGSATGGSARRVTGFDPGHVAISFSPVANAIDGVTGLRPYREATLDCGGPDTIRMITVTGSFTYAPLGFWSLLGPAAVPTVRASHSERCIGRS
jgi:Flp pilus assembly protein TadG